MRNTQKRTAVDAYFKSASTRNSQYAIKLAARGTGEIINNVVEEIHPADDIDYYYYNIVIVDARHGLSECPRGRR